MVDFDARRAQQKNRIRRRGIYLLPNLFTTAALFGGFYAIVQAMNQRFDQAAVAIFVAMVLDGLDGRVARLTKTQSALGVQLDSLADVISFGVAPAVLVYRWSLASLDLLGLFACFAFVAAGVVRLARFNVLTTNEAGAPKKAGKYIVGLPIPGAAGILVSLVVANHSIGGSLGERPFLLLSVVLLLSVCMVSTIRFRSFKDFRLTGRTLAFIALAVTSTVVVAVQVKPAFALVWLMAWYVLIGLCEAALGLWLRTTRRSEREAPRES